MRRPIAAIAAFASVLALSQAAAAAELSAEILPRNLEGSARERLSSAVGQFSSWHAWVEAVAAIALSVALASLLAWHPRARRPRAALDGEEERRTLIVLGMIGAIVASLVLVDQAMAFVIFGIGGLVRFRTILRTPQLTGKAILVIVIGLACGLTQYLMALVVAVAAWLVIWWLNGSRPARVRIRVPAGTDLTRLELVAADALRRMRCKVSSARRGAAGRSVNLTVRIPTALEDEIVSRSLSATLAADLPRAEIEILAS